MADVLAQANLDGGGNTELPRRPSTPLPVRAEGDRDRRDRGRLAEDSTCWSRKRGADDADQRRPDTAPAMPKPVEAPPEPVVAAVGERADAAHARSRCGSRRASPRTSRPISSGRSARFVGARAEEYRLARYVEDWRAKIERVGNLNYPEAARALQLYGRPAAHGVDPQRRQRRERRDQPLLGPADARCRGGEDRRRCRRRSPRSRRTSSATPTSCTSPARGCSRRATS